MATARFERHCGERRCDEDAQPEWASVEVRALDNARGRVAILSSAWCCEAEVKWYGHVVVIEQQPQLEVVAWSSPGQSDAGEILLRIA